MKLGKTTATLVALLATVGLAACGPAEVQVSAEISVDGPDGETVARPLGDLEIIVLPYDRDQIFDSLTSAASSPAPQIPEDIRLAQEEVVQAQQAWRESESRWNTLRDTLQTLSQSLDRMNRAEPQYGPMYREWQDLDRQYSGLDRQVSAAFDRFQELQAATITRVDSITAIRNNWADEAFADVGTVMTAKLTASGLQLYADTTDAQGAALLEIAPGEYWVHARHALPHNELYWNVPVSVVRGDPILIRLSRDNAEVRSLY